MFKVIKIESFDKFRCTAGECPENCCDNRWDIIVDEDTYTKYLEMGIPDLDQKITKTVPHKIIKDVKCPFITEEGLCFLQLHYGEKYLSNTCRSYPRFVSTYGDLYIENLGISCPEAARSLFYTKHFLQLQEVIYYEKEEEQGFRPAELGSERLMKILLSFFSTNEATLENAFDQAYDFFGFTRQCGFDVEKNVFFIRNILNSSLNPEQSHGLEIDSDKTVEPVDLRKTKDFMESRFPFLLKNICISYLFEHLMLESKEPEIHYEYKIYEAEALIGIFLYILSVNRVYQDENPEEKCIFLLYKLMRILDHGSDILKKSASNLNGYT